MMIKTLSIEGFRGFNKKQTLHFSIPVNNKPGSGLNILVGSNNSGKTTIIESIQSFIGNNPPSFSEGRRNLLTQQRINLELVDETDQQYTIKTISAGGSSTEKNFPFNLNFYVIPSRRAVAFEFHSMSWDRNFYIAEESKLKSQRSSHLDNFPARLFQILKKKNEFDKILSKILGKDFSWTIEQRDSGQYYIKHSVGNISHSAEGIGDGIWSIFTICAALFDAPPDSTIIIDEPELSVHPALQKRLMSLLITYSDKYQIIISTHSPYFIDWKSIINGASLTRVTKENTEVHCYQLTHECAKKFEGLMKGMNNPHALGLESKEAFFLEDQIILVEGQEDVLCFQKIQEQLSENFNGVFFGWGAGGAANMEKFLNLFKELGYKKIACILDGDQKEKAESLQKQFKEYKIIVLSKNDIRDKQERTTRPKDGITNRQGELKDEHKDEIKSIIQNVNDFFASRP